ncbi:hypothetical protein EXIGLDRAFT_145324 [Exidia glandulosa HHB12029]|uniref:Uncharacterized protein n=1 Tax=Exidia glandulosa HHB12029 TaxID=1314781 RepID=A0A165ND53_EXIGL|nr:hypothetical protein EXIGLDRAFT_145324 [Exidia glandulosa HHB12029]
MATTASKEHPALDSGLCLYSSAASSQRCTSALAGASCCVAVQCKYSARWALPSAQIYELHIHVSPSFLPTRAVHAHRIFAQCDLVCARQPGGHRHAALAICIQVPALMNGVTYTYSR